MTTRALLLLLGLFFFLPMLLYYLATRQSDSYRNKMEDIRRRQGADGTREAIEAEVRDNIEQKMEFFHTRSYPEQERRKLVAARLEERAKLTMREEAPGLKPSRYPDLVAAMLKRPLPLLLFVTIGLPGFVFLILMSNPFVKYTYERLIMMVFVVFGVTFLVFTILYISPMDASYNILGDLVTPEQRAQFNHARGLDRPYIEQLFSAFKGIATLDPGQSLLGGEDVISQLANKFPITLQLTFFSLSLAVLIAVPSGIFSALKPYSLLDYVIMLFALIGLSIPAFWFGLLLILNFSIEHSILPAIFVPGTWTAYIMPAVIMGTGLAASIARMTRSSMLEIKHQDFIVTAKAKGLSPATVTMRHTLGNAMIPIVTVIGLDFGAMMAGATVVEKVFNMPGIGSWLIDKQFIPDTPAVLAGVVYIAIIVSIVNLFVDLLYAFLDPRIKAKIKGI
jgi:peptide/nickel transport system permease protein